MGNDTASSDSRRPEPPPPMVFNESPPARIGTAPAQKSSTSFDQHALAQKFQRGEALAGGFFKGDRIQYRNERSGTVTGPAAKKACHDVSVAGHFDDSQPFALEDVRVADSTRV